MAVTKTFKERILTTMNHEEPDQVPVMSLLCEPSNVTRYTGKDSANYFKYLKDPKLRDMTESLMNQDAIWNIEFFNFFRKLLNMAIELKFDANWMWYLIFKFKKDESNPLNYLWYDIWGRRWELRIDNFGNPVPHYVGGFCSTEEEWDAWIENNTALFDNFIQSSAQFHKKIVEKCGKDIYVMNFAAGGIFENSWQPIGFTEFVKYLYEKPKFIERVVEFQTAHYLKHVEAICRAGNEVIIIGDDLGHKTGPLLNPELLEKFFGPSYRQVAEFVHKQHKKIILHSCGNLYKLLDKIIAWGVDGLLTLEPTASMELGKVRQLVGHKLVLIGNLDVTHLLVKGSKKEIKDAVRKAIKDAAPGGGFILSPSHNHSDVDPVRLQWMVEAAHEFGKYPIQI
jgi:uroporphyrinogen-III decarboxylase